MLANRVRRCLVAAEKAYQLDPLCFHWPASAACHDIATKYVAARCVGKPVNVEATWHSRSYTHSVIAHSDVKELSSSRSEEVDWEERADELVQEVVRNAAECAANGQIDGCGLARSLLRPILPRGAPVTLF
jgi:hypothetical protein